MTTDPWIVEIAPMFGKLSRMSSSDDVITPQSEDREARFQSIFEAASCGITIHDLLTGLVVQANPAACEIYGYSQDEFIGLHWDSIILPDSSLQFTK